MSTHVYSCLLMSTNVYNRPHEMSYLCRVFRKGASAYTSLCLRSTFVHSSFDLRSSFVRPSFDLRSTFVRASFGKRKQTKTKRRNNKISKNLKPQTLKPQNLKHNGNAKRSHLKNQWFCRQSYLQADRWSDHRIGKSRAECVGCSSMRRISSNSR